MNFTIPATKYTKAIVVSIHGKLPSGGYGMIVAFIADVKKATKGDECYFINTKMGFSKHKLENDY